PGRSLKRREASGLGWADRGAKGWVLCGRHRGARKSVGRHFGDDQGGVCDEKRCGLQAAVSYELRFSRVPYGLRLFELFRRPLLIGGRAVECRNGDVVETEIDSELRRVVDEMVEAQIGE